MAEPAEQPAGWDDLQTWLNSLTKNITPDLASTPAPTSHKEIEDAFTGILRMRTDTAHSHKELEKIFAALAHHLLAQVKLSEEELSQSQQRQATLEQTLTRRETTIRVQEKQLQDLEGDLLQLRQSHILDAEAAKERCTTTETELQQAKELLRKAQEELVHRQNRTQDAENKVCHLEADLQRRSHQLTEVESELKDKLQVIDHQRQELYYLQQTLADERRGRQEPNLANQSRPDPRSDTAPITDPRIFSRPVSPLRPSQAPILGFMPQPLDKYAPIPAPKAGAWHQQVPTPKDLDRLARTINHFTPSPSGGHDVHTYLRDVEYHIDRLTHVTDADRLHLIRITASAEVRRFLDRQPDAVKLRYPLLRQAMILEFSDPESEQGLTVAMDLKQGRLESPIAYYQRLRRAYFGPRNDIDMEEDYNFKTLFLRNLHPTVNHHLGVMACPKTMSSLQLKELALKAFNKQKAAAEKQAKTPAVMSITHSNPDLALEGAPVAPAPRERRPLTGLAPRDRDRPPSRPGWVKRVPDTRRRPTPNNISGNWSRHDNDWKTPEGNAAANASPPTSLRSMPPRPRPRERRRGEREPQSFTLTRAQLVDLCREISMQEQPAQETKPKTT